MSSREQNQTQCAETSEGYVVWNPDNTDEAIVTDVLVEVER
jgi:hypothetical protein